MDDFQKLNEWWKCGYFTLLGFVLGIIITGKTGTSPVHDESSKYELDCFEDEGDLKYVYVDQHGVVHNNRKCSKLIESERSPIGDIVLWDRTVFCPNCISDMEYMSLKWYVTEKRRLLDTISPIDKVWIDWE